MKPNYGVLGFAGAMVLGAGSAYAYQPYAEDLLREQRAAHISEAAPCPKINELHISGKSLFSEAEANALLCHLREQVPLATQVMEHGCTDRSEVLIGMLIGWGVPMDALGRASTFYDAARNQGGNQVFVLEDPAHASAFNHAWQLVFGNSFAKTIRLTKGEQEYLLDVSGAIRWNIGHIAPTLWVQGTDGKRALRVIDPVLSPDAVLTLADWRRLQQAEPAALLWGKLGDAPDILPEYLSGAMAERFRKRFDIALNETATENALDIMLRNTPPEMKAQLYAQVLDIAPKSPWHPREWRGYSFGGGALPDWQAGNDAVSQRRYDRAKERLAPLVAYEEMRASFDDDEAFLEAVRDAMKRKQKKPEEVFIDFDEE